MSNPGATTGETLPAILSATDSRYDPRYVHQDGTGLPSAAVQSVTDPLYKNGVTGVASVNLLDHQVSGAVGVGSATADTAAFTAAIAAAIAQAPISLRPGSIKIPNAPITFGKYLLNNNPFASFAGSSVQGISIEGEGERSTFLQLQVGASPTYFYDNGSADKTAFMHFSDLCFQWSNPNGANAVQSTNANGFRYTSHGSEQGMRFFRCQFGDFDSTTNTYLGSGGVLFDFEGTTGNDSHKLLLCRIAFCSGDIYLWNNPQAVTIELFGTNIEGCYGNIFHIGSGGGGDLHVYGGDCLQDIHPADSSGTTYWFLKVDNQTTGTGLGNAHYTFHGTKFEMRNPLRGWISVGILGQCHVKFVDVTPTIVNDTTSQRPVVNIGDNCRVSFVRTPIQGPGFGSTLASATSLGTVPLVGTTNTTTAVTGMAPSLPVGNVYNVAGPGIPATTTLTVTGAGTTGTLSNAATTSVTGNLLTLTQTTGSFSVPVIATNSTHLPTSGTILVGGFPIPYTGFTGGGGSAITFTGCTGGQGAYSAGQSVQTASPCLFIITSTATSPQIESIAGHISFDSCGIPEDLPYNISFPGCGNLSTALSTAAPITSLPTHALPIAIPSGTTVTTNDGAGHTQQWVTTAPAAVAATSIAVTSQTPNFNYPATTTGLSCSTTSGYGTASSTNCHGSHGFGVRHALDFDLNGRWTAQGGPSLRRKIAVVKGAASNWPEVNIVESVVMLPPGALITGVYAVKPANAAASTATYQLILGSFDKSVQYGTSVSGQQKLQHTINVSNIFTDSTGEPLPNLAFVRLWATGGSGIEAGNGNGYVFVEYI